MSQRSNIEQEKGRNLTLSQSTFCRPGGVPIRKCENAFFFIFMYIYEDFSDLLWCFLFAEILPNHATVPELPNLSVSKACQELSTNVTHFNKNDCLKPPSSLGHWCTGAYLRIFDPCPSNFIISLGLCSPVTTGSV